MSIKIIAAIGDNNELGYLNDLPWENISEDMIQFMETTMGETLIMGRATWDSLDGEPLPGRTMVVISRKKIKMPKGHFCYTSPEKAMAEHPNAWVIGGASMYPNAMGVAKEMVISHIDGSYTADRFFPVISNVWVPVEREVFDKFTRIRYVRD